MGSELQASLGVDNDAHDQEGIMGGEETGKAGNFVLDVLCLRYWWDKSR